VVGVQLGRDSWHIPAKLTIFPESGSAGRISVVCTICSTTCRQRDFRVGQVHTSAAKGRSFARDMSGSVASTAVLIADSGLIINRLASR
jgi:hypothetical protein